MRRLLPPAVVYVFAEDRKAIRAGLMRTGVLLRACAAEVLGRPRRDEIADCRGSAVADCGVLRH